MPIGNSSGAAVTTANPAQSVARQAVRRILANYGAPGASWFANGLSESEVARMHAMQSTPLGRRLGEHRGERVTFTDALSIFRCGPSQLAALMQGGMLPRAAKGRVTSWAWVDLARMTLKAADPAAWPNGAPECLSALIDKANAE